MDWLFPLYPWILAFHIISMVAWMAAMFYLPRLFVYHTETAPGSESSERFKVMERRLLRAIGNPAMIATWTFGALLLYVSPMVSWSAGWLHLKLLLVAAMTVLHHLLALWRKDFAADRNRRSARFYRIANEVPTVLLIGIVILAVVKPF